MRTVTSVDELKVPGAPHSGLAIYSALEIVLVYGGIMIYVWRWRSVHPQFWVALLAIVFTSHFVHGDSLRSLGLSLTGIRANAQVVLPIALGVYIPILAFGIARHTLTYVPVNWHALFRC